MTSSLWYSIRASERTSGAHQNELDIFACSRPKTVISINTFVGVSDI